jgi:hypothetical protein
VSDNIDCESFSVSPKNNNIHDRYYVIALIFCNIVILNLNSEYGDFEIEFQVELNYVGGNMVLIMLSNLGLCDFNLLISKLRLSVL